MSAQERDERIPLQDEGSQGGGGEVSENDKSENHIEPFDPSRARQKRRANDKRDGHDIENEEPITKLPREAAFAEIEAT